MNSRVLIVADDLSGAGDSGVPFASHGMRTLLSLGGAEAEDAAVYVVDTDSRDLHAATAASRVAGVLREHAEDRVVFKKIDSTLRGNLATEIGVVVDHAGGRGVLLCPASPATARTVRDGVLCLDGTPLHRTDAWGAEPLDPPASVAAALAPLRVGHLGLDAVRGPIEQLSARLVELRADCDVVVCDAVADTNLRAVVTAGLGLPEPPHWVGAAGLAAALADALGAPAETEAPPRVDGPVLAVVGSANAASRRQAEVLAEHFAHDMRLSTDELLSTSGDELGRLTRRLDAALRTGDVVVRVDGPVDVTVSRRLSAALAEVCAPASEHAGLLVLTGGETARAVLDRRGITALDVRGELDAGVVLARTRPCSADVITKAGGFGTPDTLHRAVAAVRSGRNVE